MDSLTLEQASYLAEIIGVIGVVISLFYIGFQMKQHTFALQVSTAHQISEQLHMFYSFTGQDAETSAIFIKGMTKCSPHFPVILAKGRLN